jgi:hypothetical protein
MFTYGTAGDSGWDENLASSDIEAGVDAVVTYVRTCSAGCRDGHD